MAEHSWAPLHAAEVVHDDPVMLWQQTSPDEQLSAVQPIVYVVPDGQSVVLAAQLKVGPPASPPLPMQQVGVAPEQVVVWPHAVPAPEVPLLVPLDPVPEPVDPVPEPVDPVPPAAVPVVPVAVPLVPDEPLVPLLLEPHATARARPATPATDNP